MKHDKVNVLFIVSEFYQAGTERYTYEIDRAIDKGRFNVEILCLLPLNNSSRFTDHYYQKHLDLGTKIHFMHDVDVLEQPTLLQRVKRRLTGGELPFEHQALRDFFEPFDCISILGEYNFVAATRWMTAEQRSRCFIHPQNSVHQKADNYAGFPKNEHYHFVALFEETEVKWELSEFSSYDYTYFGLNLRIDNTHVKQEYRHASKPRIGIFTRLTPGKPLDPFIYAFQCILETLPEAELHIYGSGDPKGEGMMRYVEQLKLEKHVHFRGHQPEMLRTAVEENLDLVWLMGYHGLPGGWAGYDMCTAKVPQLFWNFGDSAHPKRHVCFPMFNNILQLAQHSVELLTNPEAAKQLADAQFDYVKSNLDIDRSIAVLENVYSQMALKNRS